jgi:hypothetical protein
MQSQVQILNSTIVLKPHSSKCLANLFLLAFFLTCLILLTSDLPVTLRLGFVVLFAIEWTRLWRLLVTGKSRYALKKATWYAGGNWQLFTQGHQFSVPALSSCFFSDYLFALHFKDANSKNYWMVFCRSNIDPKIATALRARHKLQKNNIGILESPRSP